MCGVGCMDSSIDKTLWVYGDSFVAPSSQWVQIIADKLKLDYVSFQGQAGSSLEYTSIRLSDTHSLWKSEDVVIVCLTEVHRIHGFSPGNHNQDRPVRKVNTALRNHMIYSLSYLKEKSNLRAMVVLDGFNDSSKANSSVTIPDNLIYSTKGSLMEVTQEEIKDPQARSSGVDSRENHLSPVNHEILADKVLSAIESEQDIDLSEGFRRKIFDMGENKSF